MEASTDRISTDLAWTTLLGFPESLVLLDATHKVQLVNLAALKSLGHAPDTKKASWDLDRIFARREDIDRMLAELKLRGSYEAAESVFTMEGGAELRTSFKATAILDATGSPIGVLILIGLSSQDRVSEYASKLESKIKELDQFAYIVSHDLKAPLRAIGNLTGWIREDIEGVLGEDSKKNMELLVGRVSRMEALINGVLEYSKIGRLQVKPELVDVHELLTEVIESLAPQAHVQVRIGSNMQSIVAPRILLSQVFSNLISNAIKHNDKKEPLIDISVVPYAHHIEFSVEDNGPGIAPEHHEKIFMIFQTLQSRDKFESTGVGLTIVKRIIEEQGGTIRVESTQGKGSTFIFSWPRTETFV